jgi:hypothetical protein
MNNQTLREKIIATNIAKKRGGGKLREEERTPTYTRCDPYSGSSPSTGDETKCYF